MKISPRRSTMPTQHDQDFLRKLQKRERCRRYYMENYEALRRRALDRYYRLTYPEHEGRPPLQEKGRPRRVPR